MSSRLRGSAKDKEEPRTVSSSSSKSRIYLSSTGEPINKARLEGSRSKVSRKDSRGKYEEQDYPVERRRDESARSYDIRNGNWSARFVPDDRDADEDEDPDLMYRRSRDHFGTWNIQDIIGQRESSSQASSHLDKKLSRGDNSERKSRFDIFASTNGVTGGKTMSNGNSRSKYRSPDDVNEEEEEEDDGDEDDDDREWFVGRSNDRERSASYKVERKSLSSVNKTKSNKRDSLSAEEAAAAVLLRRSKSPPVREIDSGINSPRYEDAADTEKSSNRSLRNNRNNSREVSRNESLIEEIERFGIDRNPRGSPDRVAGSRRYGYGGGNHSPESPENDKIRLLIDKFKTDSRSMRDDDKERRKKGGGREGEKFYGKVVTDDDGFGSMDRRGFGKDSIDDYDNKNESIDRRSGRIPSSNRRSKIVDKGGEDLDDDAIYRSSDKRSVIKNRGNDREPFGESSKQRKSGYVYSGEPDEFDVEILRYERPKRDEKRERERGRDSESLRRRSSLKIKGEESSNGRHNRALTPPEERRTAVVGRGLGSAASASFGSKEWEESDNKFSNRNSRIRVADNEFAESDEPMRGGGGGGEWKRRTTTYFGDRRKDPSNSSRPSLDRRESIEGNNIGSKRYSTESETTGEAVNTETRARRNAGGMRIEPAVTIRIRNAMTEDDERFETERKSERNVSRNEEETGGRRNKRRDDEECRKNGRRTSRDKDCWTSASTTPSRKIWSYREGGAQITDVDVGQPCLKCGDTCPGFCQHTWRKNCNSCKCPREAHDVCHEEWVSVRSRLGLKGDGGTGSVACDPREMGLAWAPPGLPPHKVEEYFSMLPERSVPRLGTPGERYRDRQLAMQLPKQDLAKAYCRHLASEHYTSADDFMAARNEIALDIGTVLEVLESGTICAGCNESLEYGSLAVSAGKLCELYHPGCFQCVQCRELLVDLAYCVYNDAVYCERHYAERLKGRCAACDELIFSGEFTKAMNKDWHSGHFCCWQCDESLTGQRYVLRDEHPYCIKCYESVFANGCEECSKIIGIDSKDLSYKDKHWHEACFLCNKCRVSLVDKQFGSKVDKIYCGNCYDAQFASRCDGCGEIFRAGTKKMEYKTRQWHEKCFCCVVCKNPIGTKSFIPREQEIYCAGCYEDKFATRCVKCNKIITSGGVTYKNEPWHRECFTCSNCSTSLAGQRFTSRDEKPYCAECFGELFAKRCTACTKPITGIGGTRFISFEDRHWHNDCFICAGCKTSLVGHGFITDGDDIICPECAKQKLM